MNRWDVEHWFLSVLLYTLSPNRDVIVAEYVACYS